MNINDAMYEKGRMDALGFQTRSAEMSGTEMYAEKQIIPDFAHAVQTINMLERPIGFICKSPGGRVVRLLQPYDSDVYTQSPEELPSLWGFEWSTNPADALPFISLSTSPYNTGECCTEDGNTFKSKIDNNVWAPSAYSAGWEQIGG